LNEVLRSHPCFLDGAKLTRVTAPDSSVYALLRESADASERVLVIVNTDPKRAQLSRFEPSLLARGDASSESFDPATLNDLLGQRLPEITRGKDGQLEC